MGIITIEKTDRLFWLGRYIERAYTTLKEYMKGYDRMIDGEEDYYKELCEKLGLIDTYGSTGAFVYGFAYDENNSFSIISNITRAYDNAVLLRDEIGTDTLAYIHMAIDELQRAKLSVSPIFDLQKVLDNILAFWGSLDDEIAAEKIRNTAKAGKRYERLDLAIRFEYGKREIKRDLSRFEFRLVRSSLSYNKAPLKHLEAMMDENVSYEEMLMMAENIF